MFPSDLSQETDNYTISSLPLPLISSLQLSDPHSFPPLPGRDQLRPLPGLLSHLKNKIYGQTFYPPAVVEDHFRDSLRRFEVKKSLVAKKGSHCSGLFLRTDSAAIRPSTNPIGVYSGRISSGFGAYHLALPSCIIDGTPDPKHPMTCFGMMNEDIYEHKYNVRINKDGTLQVIATIFPGDELLTTSTTGIG